MDREILSQDEAGRIGLRFIRDKYFRARVTLGQARLVTEEAFPVYDLEGYLSIPPRDVMSKLFAPAAEYTFSMQVHAVEGSILGYELR